MAPDLMSIDPSFDDDAHLLAAIERAWPVPPMPGRMKESVMEAITPASPGNLIAPITALPARSTPRRSWNLLARIAAVIALVLAGTLAITHENGPERGAPIFIQAPSPEVVDCDVPLRSREELEAFIDNATKNDLAVAGRFKIELASVYEFSPTTDEEVATLDSIMKKQQRCIENGVPFARLTSVSDALAESIIATNLAGGMSPETMLETLLPPYPANGTQDQRSFYWDYTVSRAGDRLVAYVLPDGFGNSTGSWFVQQDGRWILDSAGLILGPWSSLATNPSSDDVPLQSKGCVPGTLRTWREANELKTRLDQNAEWPPIDISSPLETFALTMGTPTPDGSEQAIIDVIDGYRQCLQGGKAPTQFALTTDDFFMRYVATDQNGNVQQPSGGTMLSSQAQSMIPSQVQSVTQLDDGRAIAVLESNPEWAEASGLKAGILLVNQNGQWLIDQLVLVENQG